MASKKRKSKIRVEFRKNYDQRTRKKDFTKSFQTRPASDDDSPPDPTGERLTGRQEHSKKRTVTGVFRNDEATGFAVDLESDGGASGRVIKVHGLASTVRLDDGRMLECATRGLLKSMATDLQNVVVTGDRVGVRVLDDRQGLILRVHPRRGTICRTSRQRQQILVANVDQVVIITSAAEPKLKPNLVDRFLLSAESSGLTPIICINKIDLIDAADLQPVAGVWSQLGYQVILLSVHRGWNIEPLRRLLTGKDSVVAGQSGVGKSSLLNAIEPGLGLRVGAVSVESQKGKHTTTFSQLFPLSGGGHLVDTPGIRSFELWDVIPEEVAGFFRDIRPFVGACQFPDCTHTHEQNCAVKEAVADFKIDVRRYESYCQIQSGE